MVRASSSGCSKKTTKPLSWFVVFGCGFLNGSSVLQVNPIVSNKKCKERWRLEMFVLNVADQRKIKYFFYLLKSSRITYLVFSSS